MLFGEEMLLIMAVLLHTFVVDLVLEEKLAAFHFAIL